MHLRLAGERRSLTGHAAAGWRGKADLQAVITGEALPQDLAAALEPVVQRLWNLYGPTETTIWSAARLVDRPPDVNLPAPAYELLGGQRPFSGDSYSTVLRSILTVEPPEVTHFNPLVPDDVAQIVRGMLQKDVGKRYATIAQVRQELEAVIEQLGLHRGKDLLREYALNPQVVGDAWRRKRLSRHMDQGLFYENMGLGKIDDALLEFRRVLYLDPDNAAARDHVKKLERDREAVIARAREWPFKGATRRISMSSAAQPLGNPLADHQPQTASANLSASGQIGSVETFKDPAQMFFRNTKAIVTDLD